MLYFSGSACTNGKLSLASSATTADANRLFATVALAKTSGQRLFVFYDDSLAPGACNVISFGLIEGG